MRNHCVASYQRIICLVILLLTGVVSGWSQALVCTSAPTPGTATASSATVCEGSVFNLSLDGETTGENVMYFVEWSPTSGGPFTIVGATGDPNGVTTTARPGTNYYRVSVYCTGLSASTNEVAVFGKSRMSGVYTINSALAASATNFVSFNDAVAALANCGVGGPVVLDVTTDHAAYNERVAIPEIAGASDVNTITFNGNGNTLYYTQGTDQERYVFMLDGADYIILDSLHIDASGGDYGFGIVLTNGASNNIIRRCVVDAGVNVNQDTHAGILLTGYANVTNGSNSGCTNNVITNNTIKGGSYGVTVVGHASDLIADSVINNNIQDNFTCAVYIDNTDGVVVAGNKISRPTRTWLLTSTYQPGLYYGIRLVNTCSNALISDNQVCNTSDGDKTNAGRVYGIILDAAHGTVDAPAQIVNNMVYNINGTGGISAIYSNYSSYAKIYHNTVALENLQKLTDIPAGLMIMGSSAIEIKNNLVTISGATGGPHGYCIYSDAATSMVSDNNDFFVADGVQNYIGYKGTSYHFLSDWQAATGLDALTVSINPLYQSVKDAKLIPNNTALDNKGVPVGVMYDIVNDVRDGSTPDIGAYEFSHVYCTNPPAAGTVTASENPICLSGSSALNLFNGETGEGVSYQWQSSADGSSWTNVNAAVTDSLRITQSTDTWYRMMTTCGTGNTASDAVLIKTMQGFSGTYTINNNQPTGGTNFNSFTDAWNAVKCGITGPVVFNVAPGSGPYNEQLITAQVSGASAVNTITINGNGNKIAYTSINSNERAVIKLNGTDHLIVNNLVVEAGGNSSSNYGFAVQLYNHADSNVISHCVIITDSVTSSRNFAGIAVSGSATDASDGSVSNSGNVFEDNVIRGGYYGISLAAANANLNIGNIVRRNKILNFYRYGIYETSSVKAIVDSNSISRPTRSNVDNCYGIYIAGDQTLLSVTRNSVSDPFGGNTDASLPFYGIYTYASTGSSGFENVYSNNIIYNTSGSGEVYAIYNTASGYAWYYHNTINIDGYDANNNTVYGFYQELLAGSIRFRNNIVTINRLSSGSKYAVYLATPSTVFLSANNDMYISSPEGNNNIGYNGLDRKLMANWQTVGYDANSTSVDPHYVDVAGGNLKPTYGAINNAGMALTGTGAVVNDITGVARNAAAPDPGAYEFDPVACAAPASPGVVAASAWSLCQDNPIELNLSGNSTGGGQTYQWQASAAENGTYAAISPVSNTPWYVLNPGTDPIYYRAAVTCSGNTMYTVPVQINISAKLKAGVYTIDKNGTGDFSSFNEAKAALACGINGPVMFNVKPDSGPYEEQLELDSIIGTSSVNTVTFNGNGNTITWSQGDYDNRSVITLKDADYVIFDSLRITMDGTADYGTGVYITGNADYNIFRKCVIDIPLSVTSYGYTGVVIGGSPQYGTFAMNTSDYNTFQNDTIRGGYCGMSVCGAYQTNLVFNNRFTGNYIEDAYAYGIYIGSVGNAFIDGNSVTRPNRNADYEFNAIYATSNSASVYNLQITGNKIFNNSGGNPSATSSFYGIHLSFFSPFEALPTIVANNLIYNINSSGNVYGIHSSWSSYGNVYHNTIALDNKNLTGSTSSNITAGIYLEGSTTGIQVQNNIITALRGGLNRKFGIYADQSAATFTSDNNDVYTEAAAGSHYFGYALGAIRATLADWQTATSKDGHSLNKFPVYTDSANGDFTPALADLDNKGVYVGINTDINNKARSTSTPDIGAVEFSTTVCTSPPTAGAAAATPSSGICMGTMIKLTLSGNSEGGSQKYIWQSAPATTGPWTNISDSLDAGGLTYQLGAKDVFFRAAVICGGQVAYSDSVQVVRNGGLMAGDYTIDSSLPTGNNNFRSFNEAVTAMLCGIEGAVRFHAVPGIYNERVRVPYIPGASATATVTFMSRDNDAATVTLTAPCSYDTNYVLKLDTASYVSFKNITFNAAGTNYAHAVEFTTTASADSIAGCIIQVPASTSVNPDVVGIYGLQLSGTRNVLFKNTISSGMAGIYLQGVDPFADGFVIDSNKVSGGYSFNIYAKDINNISVSGNTVLKSGVQYLNSYGIYLFDCDSVYHVDRNNIVITNTDVNVSGIFLFLCKADYAKKGSVSANHILADSTNHGYVYGIENYTNTCNYNAMNNVIVISSAGDRAYGVHSTGTNGGCNFYNNSILVTSATVSGAPVFMSDNTDNNGGNSLFNNVLVNKGGGVALDMARPGNNSVDYNLYYSTGAGLVQYNADVITTLPDWQAAANWDYNSLVYKPVFVSDTTLAPDVANENVWAMQGRGVQIDGDSVDINGAKRSTTLRAGVPDLGAYEFLPTVSPVLLTAIPADPSANSTQAFMLGTDTVTTITWGNVVPTHVEGRRFSGVAPEGLASGQKFMYFYTSFTTTGTAPVGQTVKQFYVDSWRGYIDDENTIKMGKTNVAGTWEIDSTSHLDVNKNTITDTGLTVLNKFTGLTDGKTVVTPVVINNRDSSNRGTKFWTSYANHVLFNTTNAQQMVLYLGAGGTDAHVTVRVNGTSWIRTYTVPANTVTVSDFIPKSGVYDARLLTEGLSDRGVSIESDVPISAYTHIYGPYASGATMLLPVGTYGYEYFALSGKQTYNGPGSNASMVNVIAAYDNTVLQITPSLATQGGHAANVPFTVTLNKGQVYQLLGAIDPLLQTSNDLSGTRILSVKNEDNRCWPVAVFSGSSLTGFTCDLLANYGTGDNLLQQNFPYQAWGKKYLTAPLSNTAADDLATSIYRIGIKDPATVVQVNGKVLSGLKNNSYYEYTSNTADYIESDKPVMVAQFETSGGFCGYGKVGDPEMIYLSPLEQGINEVALYRNTTSAILVQYLTLIIPTAGVNTLTIDGGNTFDYTYPHPAKPGYTVVVRRWDASKGQTFVKSDSAFTAITYGMGEYESYGYNAGTLVNNLNTKVSLSNNYATGSSSNDYTCAGAPFKLKLTSTVAPTIIQWALSGVSNMTPNSDITIFSPKPTDTVVINGVTYYEYALDTTFIINTPGDYNISAFITHPDIDACDSRQETIVPIKVVPAPKVDFSVANNCAAGLVQFTGAASTENGASVVSWAWNFDDAGAVAHSKDTVHNYKDTGSHNVKLAVVDNAGCIGDTVKIVRIGSAPPIVFVKDTVAVCPDGQATLQIANAVTGVQYNWYDAATGGNQVNTGDSMVVTGITATVTYWVESTLEGCTATSRKPVTATPAAALATPVVKVDSVGSTSITFSWTAVPGATGYLVSTDKGTTWVTPSSGATGLRHTVTGLQTGQTVSILVKALGGCQPVISAEAEATTVVEDVFVPNTFTPDNSGLAENEQFRVYGNDIKELKLAIFNQWGEKVFESKNQADGWDGRYKGKPQPSGVYIYVADILMTNNKRITKKGTVNLIR